MHKWSHAHAGIYTHTHMHFKTGVLIVNTTHNWYLLPNEYQCQQPMCDVMSSLHLQLSRHLSNIYLRSFPFIAIWYVSCSLMELSPSWEAANCAATQELPAFYGTWRFITVFTRPHHWSLSWARSIQSIPDHLISLRSILILSTHLHLGRHSGLFPSGFPTNILYAFLFSHIRATCPSHHTLLDFNIVTMIGEE
jgi:hypothetical protein